MKLWNLCLELNRSGDIERSMQNGVTSEPIGDAESQLPCKEKRKGNLYITLSLNITISAIILIVLLLLEFDVIRMKNSGFYCKDPKLSFKYNGDTVQATPLLLSLFFLPIIIIFITEYICTKTGTCREKISKSFKIGIAILGGFFFGMIYNTIIFESIKLIKRDPRPSFFDICNPDAGLNCTEGEYIANFECTPDLRFFMWFQHDASLSFPSGHTALSVYTALFLIWYLQRRAFSWSAQYFLLVPLIQWLLIVFAATCSLTRITDHRHHWWDVLAGFVIGTVSAIYSIIVFCKNFPMVEESARKSRKTLPSDEHRIEQISI